jgi:hypothetical protein
LPWWEVPTGRADIAPLNDGDEFEVTVAGELMGGESFSGTDLVRVVVPGPGEAPPLAVSVFPNVFKNTVSISYEVADDAPVSLRIYDVAGRSVKTLVNEHKPAGRYVVTWDRTANDGHRIGTGVYFIRVEHKETVVLRKVLAVQ